MSTKDGLIGTITVLAEQKREHKLIKVIASRNAMF